MLGGGGVNQHMENSICFVVFIFESFPNSLIMWHCAQLSNYVTLCPTLPKCDIVPNSHPLWLCDDSVYFLTYVSIDLHTWDHPPLQGCQQGPYPPQNSCHFQVQTRDELGSSHDVSLHCYAQIVPKSMHLYKRIHQISNIIVYYEMYPLYLTIWFGLV